jgi:hypothetical protein
VVSVFSTIFVAVPAFIRVLPVTTSGPTAGQITTSALTDDLTSGEHVTNRQAAPIRLAR